MKSLKLVVITMVQSRDFPSAWSSLTPLSDQLSTSRERIILLNDERNPDLEDELHHLPHTTLLLPGVNLGVARGRNALFEAAMTRGADFLVVLDDDLYVPSDYLDAIHHIADTSDSTLGIFAPTVLGFVPFAKANTDLISIEAAVTGELEATLDSVKLRERIDPGDVEMFYHLGVRNWKQHYLTPSSDPGRQLARKLADTSIIGSQPSKEITFLRNDAGSRVIAATVKNHDRQHVDTLPGGVSVLSVPMLEKIGLCDNRFSPFGYEDADLCIRARQAGYQNAWIPSIVVLHDFQESGIVRSPEKLAFVYGRAKALLAANHIRSDELSTQIGFALSPFLADVLAVSRHRAGRALNVEQILASIAAFACGYISGACVADSGKPALFDRLVRLPRGTALETDRRKIWNTHRLIVSSERESPMVSAHVVVEEGDGIGTSAVVRVRFPGGPNGTFDLSFVSDRQRQYESVLLRRLSIQGTGKGLAELGFDLGMPSGASVITREISKLLSRDGGPQAGALNTVPNPPVGFEELARTPVDTASGIARLGISAVIQESTFGLGARTDG